MFGCQRVKNIIPDLEQDTKHFLQYQKILQINHFPTYWVPTYDDNPNCMNLLLINSNVHTNIIAKIMI